MINTMKPLSSSLRLRLLVGAAIFVFFSIALVGYFTWRKHSPSKKNYQAMVSAFYSGVVAMQVGDDDHALSSLTMATTIAPQEPSAWADLGLFALRHNNLDSARQMLQKARDLAPKNGQIAALFGLLETQQGHFPEAVAAYREAVQLDPSNLRAHYALEEALQQQAGPDADAESMQQFQAIYDAGPNNLFAQFNLALAAAKAGNRDLLRKIVSQIAAHSASWPPEVQQDLKTAQTAAGSADPRSAIVPLRGLQNELGQDPKYQDDALKIRGSSDTQGTPLDRLLSLPNPSPTPAPPDTALKFTAQPLAASSPGPWAWAGTVSLKTNAAPTLLTANGKELLVGQVSFPFPGGPKTVPPTPNGILAFDARNSGLLDIACAGAGGFKFYQQNVNGTFSDVTNKTKLPPAILRGAYSGVWNACLYTGGALDLILGTASGTPTVLRNNADGTWTVTHPFGPARSGLTQFVWADLDGDGSPDAAFIDSLGHLVVLQNKRAGVFTPWPLPMGVGSVAALSTADLERDGTQDLIALTSGGAVRRLSLRADSNGWDIADLGYVSATPSDGSSRLYWADLDNNGALDLIISHSESSFIWLGDEQGKLVPLSSPANYRTVTVDAQATNGRLDLIGLNKQGQPVRLVSTGAKNYAWQEVRLQAAAQGDKRNNTYGIGSKIDLRAGLLYESQLVSGPVTHFGLGDYPHADSIRIVWPNGSTQGEFELKPNQLAEAPERLKGSCPWLFADDGTAMKFVTDFIWRSPLGLRINAQDTAGVVQTRDWVKVRGDQLKPRDGFYNLRITADLWETHFFDNVKLIVVDHPVGTEINVDERFSIPPPPLAVSVMTPPQPVERATDDRGKDVTVTVSARDGKYLDTFGLGAYQGVTRDHWVTLDLGPKTPGWLVCYGWIHPTDSSINVALGQGHHTLPRDLSLEVADGKGGWRVAKPHLGFPEGKNKTILISLAGLLKPNIPHQVRLRTNMEIYWDFIGTAQALPKTPLKTQMLSLNEATLRYRGFSAIQQANWSSPELPDYSHLAGTAPRWLDLEGYCTRFGDVRELLAKTDDRYVIMNAGDEMALRFAAPPPPPPGWTRDFVFTGDGWEKDGDFNTAFSRTVLPLPSHSRPAYNTPPGRLQDDPVYKAHRQDWVNYQTRWISARQFQDALRP